jgi:hypothetical protein
MWICLPCSTPLSENFYEYAAVVEAESAEEAGARARGTIEYEREDAEADYLAHLFVIPLDFARMTALTATPVYRASEFRCCGGPCESTSDRHFVGCPNHTKEET